MTIETILRNREFDLWDFSPTHSRVLLRSPKNANSDKNIDIIFNGVEYLSIVPYLKEIKMEMYHNGNSINKPDLNKYIGKYEKLFLIKNSIDTYYIVAFGMVIIENSLD